jgi:cysteinyl-tRNA synthetase
MNIIFFNTLSRSKEVFRPIKKGYAGIYTCGPTVYDYQHIGNFRTFLFEDFLKRVLLYNGYEVFHVMNITDVGHLTSDADEGEDKMELGSARMGKSVWEIAEYYTKVFMEDASAFNIIPPSVYTKATDYIKEQLEMIKCLEEKGYTYITSDGVYFDTSKFSDYGKLAQLDISGLEEGIRVEFSTEKRNKTDFALWKFSPKDRKRQMEWESPWGIGFPGWHIECSAMSRKFLGDTFDIHCGGIDHIPVHHTNEIAQSEACTGKKFVNYWMHGAFLEEEHGKMSKSRGEFLRLKLLCDRGYSPMDYRYLCLGTHYRKRLLFSWDILTTARNSLRRLRENIKNMRSDSIRDSDKSNSSKVSEYRDAFIKAINDDLNMPQALAVMWELVRDNEINNSQKLELIYDFDRVFGLQLNQDVTAGEIPDEVMEIVHKRAEARKEKNYRLADELRDKIRRMGYELIDRKDGVELKKINGDQT